MHKPIQVLFILKKRYAYGGKGLILSSGLWNSAAFVVTMLNFNGIAARIVEVVDNNEINREVTKYKPETVIIEALWVVPAKFEVLKKLHPNVKWVVRIHSEMAFLANEGIAIGWIKKYAQMKNVTVACNSFKTFRDIQNVVGLLYADKIDYLPNYYPASKGRLVIDKRSKLLKVGCFGAIRPMKNILSQALAAMEYADFRGKILNFHINSTRIEQEGEKNLKNIRALFEKTKHHLVENPWLTHEQFLQLVRRMDVIMQVSFSETFCIVAADAISCGVPVVGSGEVFWLSRFAQADPDMVRDIVRKLEMALNPATAKFIYWGNWIGLRVASEKARIVWMRYFKKGDIL